MSYAVPSQPAAEPSRVRPTTVTVAVWLLLLVAAVYLLTGLLSLTQAGTFADVYREAYAGTDMEDAGEFIGMISAIGGGVFNLLFAVGFGVLAWLNHRGKNPARIVTWVVGGIALCCTGLSLAFAGLGDAVQGGDVNGGPDAAEVQRMINEALPDWYMPLTWVATVISILALIAALILLALPASNEFFRKQPPPAVEPPPPYPQATP